MLICTSFTNKDAVPFLALASDSQSSKQDVAIELPYSQDTLFLFVLGSSSEVKGRETGQ